MSPHVLPPLPYDYAALQPWINEQTMRIHHDAHHRACMDALNAAEGRLAELQVPDFALVRHLRRLIAWHTSEHFLHCLFWEIMGPDQGGHPRDDLAEQIADDFGSFPAFKSQFCAAAMSLECGGWVILAWQPGSQRLALHAVDGHHLHSEWDIGTLLGLDVGEHAYYVQYHHRRAEYVHNWWNTVHWPRVAQRFTAARRSGLSLAADNGVRNTRLGRI